MDRSCFYEDLRYCPACRLYVRYLKALTQAYCVECGGGVQLYSREDLTRFRGEASRLASDRDELESVRSADRDLDGAAGGRRRRERSA